ncbi:MAG: hypothetical protein ACYS47_04495 [Planctomycetota bacterium]|jgi:hypothetical protein
MIFEEEPRAVKSDKRLTWIVLILVFFIFVNLVVLYIPEWRASVKKTKGKNLADVGLPDPARAAREWGAGVRRSFGEIAGKEEEKEPGGPESPGGPVSVREEKAPEEAGREEIRVRRRAPTLPGTRKPTDVPSREEERLVVPDLLKTPLLEDPWRYAWIDPELASAARTLFDGKRVRIWARFSGRESGSFFLAVPGGSKGHRHVRFLIEHADCPNCLVPVSNDGLMAKLGLLRRGHRIRVYGVFHATKDHFLILVHDIVAF